MANDGNYLFVQAAGNPTALTVTAAASAPTTLSDQTLSAAVLAGNVTIAIVDILLAPTLNPAAAPHPMLLPLPPGTGANPGLTPGFNNAILCFGPGCTTASAVP